MGTLGAAIEAETSGSPCHVELGIFGTRHPEKIADIVDDFCATHLGQRIRAYRFYRSSVSSAHGVELDDGGRVVVKAHQARVRRGHLEAVTSVQRRLHDVSFPSPRPLIDPTALGSGTGTVEEELDGGTWHDGHEPAFRRAMAATLADLVRATDRVGGRMHGLDVDAALDVPRDEVWPTPHAPSFDFEATRRGAERIDAVAGEARMILRDVDLGSAVLGHADWRAENVRFDGTRITAVYDSQSIARSLEPVVVGKAAAVFPSNWSEPPGTAQAPTIEESRTFVCEYEAARGLPFGPTDRLVLGAAFAYVVAYVARCGHAVDPEREREAQEGFRSLVDGQGAELLHAFA